MKFVKNLKELGATINHILSIYKQLVISLGTLESAEKLKCWREAVKEMREESIRAVADRTDNVPPMLIGVDRFIRWTDNISWMVQLESPTADPVLVRVPMTPEPENQPISNVAPSHPMSVNKGKGKALPAESQAIERERTTQGDVNEDGESEVVELDIQMDEEMSEPVHGRQSGHLGGMENLRVKPKYSWAQVTACTTPPPDPHARRTCINRKIPLSEVEGSSSSAPQQQVNVAGPILVQYQDCMQALEGELADCQLMVGTLTHKIEMLRASMHGAHPAQNTAPPPIEADLFDLFRPSTNNAATVEAEESITTQLQGLVFMATASSQEMVMSGWQDSSLAMPVEVDSSSMQVGSGSGAASTGNEEQGGTVVFTDKH
ncbi:hypothetical protein BKA83DRAFT_4132737 [Pisolithus microcarpus]|nr:hypothetical protein BKA83DRAFT_4132737 [Pisolithus microcarpus]